MTPTINELQIEVVSTNTCLKDAVKTMEPIILLRNVHPQVRSDYAFRLYREGILTKIEASEFAKLG